MIVFLVVFGSVFFVLLLRGRRKNTLAGLNADRPQFLVAPPLRTMLRRKDDRP